ncbi:MAG: ATP-binding protein [candidate division WOR-3 bacterium]
MKSFFIRVFGGHLLVLIVTLAAVLMLSLTTVRRNHMATLEQGLRREATILAEVVRPILKQGRTAESDSVLEQLSLAAGTRITVIDSLGRVLADTEADPDSMENHRERPEIIAARASGQGSSLRVSRTTGREMLYYALAVKEAGVVTGYIRASTDIGPVNAALHSLTVRILVAALAILLFAIAAALLYSSELSRPVSTLVRAFRRLGSGEFGVRADPGAADELGELSRTFNETAARLEVMSRILNNQRETLDRIINSIQEGIVVLDATGQVKLANASFIRIAGDRDVVGRYHWEITREFRLGEFLRSVGVGHEPHTNEVEVSGRTYVCNASFIRPTQETVVTLHDITELKAATRMKRDLAAAASHELRTPLTAIQGYLETLEGSVSEEGKRYLEIVRRHTERLVRLVADLAQLSELEEPEFKLELETVDLSELAREETEMFRPRYAAKGLKLILLAAEPVLVEADRFRLQQVISNLLDNALRYTEEGHVELRVEREKDYAVLRVEDTGVGIASEHLPRIFERFYVVDRARSRKTGGTGLGLAIVRHIVELHQGRIEVESTPGKGTAFTIRLSAHPSA